MTKADAIRHASKILGGERSALKGVRFLGERGVKVAPKLGSVRTPRFR
jgi:hypothetical protein